MTLGEVDAMFQTARRGLRLIRPELLDEFIERSNAFVRVFIGEKGLTDEEARTQLCQASANQIVLGEKSLAKFEELQRWLADHEIRQVLVVV